jgi:hypothetical protein
MKAKAIGDADTKTTLEQEREETLSGLHEDEVPEVPSPFVEPVTITTTRTFVKGSRVLNEEVKEETLVVRDFHVPPARVGVEVGQTINMGNYESLRVTVSAQVPCYTEEMAEAYDHVVAFVKSRIPTDREEAAAWAKSKSAENLF